MFGMKHLLFYNDQDLLLFLNEPLYCFFRAKFVENQIVSQFLDRANVFVLIHVMTKCVLNILSISN